MGRRDELQWTGGEGSRVGVKPWEAGNRRGDLQGQMRPKSPEWEQWGKGKDMQSTGEKWGDSYL